MTAVMLTSEAEVVEAAEAAVEEVRKLTVFSERTKQFHRLLGRRLGLGDAAEHAPTAGDRRGVCLQVCSVI